MSGRTKKGLRKLICAGIAILALAGCAKANLVDSNSVVQDGIEYYLQTDKDVYDLGENVEILYRITNLTEEEWEVIGTASIRFYPCCTERGRMVRCNLGVGRACTSRD